MTKNVLKSCLCLSGREMFSNSTVSLERRGLGGMDYVNNLIEIRRAG